MLSVTQCSRRAAGSPGFPYLHLDVEKDNLAFCGLLFDGHLARTIAVTAKLGVLDEAILCDKVLELLHGDVVIVNAILLTFAWGAGGV